MFVMTRQYKLSHNLKYSLFHKNASCFLSFHLVAWCEKVEIYVRSRFSAGHFQHLISVTKRHPLHPSMPANAIIVITTFIVYIFIIINYSQQ